ncbi:MAG TPA: hypothetical protein VD788_16990 [Candidatus Polarisedimenticolaceae bacterium]|nr:hypothetical protein [Candidatus Polarisedimenticolaceae bacterium]
MSWRDWDALWGALPVIAWILIIVLRGLKTDRARTARPGRPLSTPGGFERAYEPIEPSFRGRVPTPPVPASESRRRAVRTIDLGQWIEDLASDRGPDDDERAPSLRTDRDG